jgi:hypothetical protein
MSIAITDQVAEAIDGARSNEKTASVSFFIPGLFEDRVGRAAEMVGVSALSPGVSALSPGVSALSPGVSAQLFFSSLRKQRMTQVCDTGRFSHPLFAFLMLTPDRAETCA